MEGLKTMRNELGYSQAGMAKHVGVSLSYYEKVERGTTQASMNFLRKLKTKCPSADINQIFFGNISNNLADVEVLNAQDNKDGGDVYHEKSLDN